MVVAAVGGIPSLGISAIAAGVAGAVVTTISALTLSYINYKDHGKGAQVIIQIKYGFTSHRIMTWKRMWWGMYLPQWKTVRVPYAYLSKYPRIIWNR